MAVGDNVTRPASRPSKPTDILSALPTHLIRHVARHLDPASLLQAMSVCRSWHNALAGETHVWKAALVRLAHAQLVPDPLPAPSAQAHVYRRRVVSMLRAAHAFRKCHISTGFVKELARLAEMGDGTFVRAIDDTRMLVRRPDGQLGLFSHTDGVLAELPDQSCSMDVQAVATGPSCVAWRGPSGRGAFMADLTGPSPRVVRLDEDRRHRCNVGVSEDGSLVWVVTARRVSVYRRDSAVRVCRMALPDCFSSAPSAIGFTFHGRQGVVLWSPKCIAVVNLHRHPQAAPRLTVARQLRFGQRPNDPRLQQVYLKPRLTDLEAPSLYAVTASSIHHYTTEDLSLRRDHPLTGVLQLCLAPGWLAVVQDQVVRIMDYGFQTLHERMYDRQTHVLNQVTAPSCGAFLLVSLKTRTSNGNMVMVRPNVPKVTALQGPSDVSEKRAVDPPKRPFVKAPTRDWAGWTVTSCPRLPAQPQSP